MKKLFVSALAMLAVALGFTACSSEDEFVNETPAQGQKVTVIASTEEPAQRTALEQDGDVYKVVWLADDKIKLIDASSNFTEFTLKSGDGTSTGEFMGEAPAAGTCTCTAYYPSTYDGSTWPAAQTYVANNIPLGVPMKAENIEVDEDRNVSPISFKNEGGILRLNLMGTAKVTSIRISATGLNAIMLDCSKETDGYVQLNSDGVPFHIAVPGSNGTEEQPGTAYSGLKIEITDDAGKVCTRTATTDITVQRSMITDITLTASSFVPTKGEAPRYSTTSSEEVNAPWVQLWAGGPKFAEYNVGAESTTEYGGYYCWGNSYDQSLKWTGTSGTLDVASTLWGSNWRTPTKAELQALLNNCDVTWTDNYNSTGKKGRIYTGRGAYASNSVFFLSAGYYTGFGSSCLDQDGCYWSSTPCDGNDGYLVTDKYYLNVGPGYQIVYGSDVAYGYSVRAVLDETPASE